MGYGISQFQTSCVILDSPGPEQRFQHVPPAGLSSLPQAVFERLWVAGLIENANTEFTGRTW